MERRKTAKTPEARKICLLHANCQGDEMERLLLASHAFCRVYRLVRRTNYTRELFSDEDLADCSLFLYQHLGPDWGEVSSRALIARLRPGTPAIRIPNQYTKAYWPFNNPRGPIADFSDSLLDRLIDEGAPKNAILRIYLHGDVGNFIDLQAAFEKSLEIERQKEASSPVKTVDYFLAHWRERMLFHTANHPSDALLIRAAQGLLAELDLPPLQQEEIASVRAQGEFPSYLSFMEMPVHPQVAAFHGLNFAGPGALFNVFGRPMTFEQYVSRYIDCRQNKLDDLFLGYMQTI